LQKDPQSEVSSAAEQAAKDEARYAAAMAAVPETDADTGDETPAAKDEPKAEAEPEPDASEKAPKAPKGDDEAAARLADLEARFDAENELKHLFGAKFVAENLKDLSTARLVQMAAESKPRREKVDKSFRELKEKAGYTLAPGVRDNANAPSDSRATRATQAAVSPSVEDDAESAFDELSELDPDAGPKAKAAYQALKAKAEQAKEQAETHRHNAQVFACQSAIESLTNEYPELKDKDVLAAVLKKADMKDPEKAAAQSALEDGGDALRALFRFAAEALIPKHKQPTKPKGGSVDVQTRTAGSKALTQAQRDELRYKAAIESGGDSAKAKALMSKWAG
jgi:hypothetical protein